MPDVPEDNSEPTPSEPVNAAPQWNALKLLRTTGPPVLLPNIFFALGEGAIIPIIPLFATQIGASLAAAALVAAMLTIGELASSMPAGWLVSKTGEKNGMYCAAAVSGVGAVVCWVSTSVEVLIAGVLLIGLSSGVFALARGSFMTIAVPLSHRGRGLSMMGGANRLGLLIGPFIAAVVVDQVGSVRHAWGITVAASIAIALSLLLWSGDAEINRYPERDPATDDSEPSGIWATFTKRSDVLIRVGLAAGLINTMRTSRQILVPLIGVALGLSAVTITTFVGICAIVDFVLFYAGGQLMDRFGRLWVAVPTMLVFGAAHVVFALVTDLPDPFVWYAGASVLMSIGNGLTSGIVATMGSDLADQRSPAAFLGSWRLVTQIGPAGAPIVIAGLTGVYSIAVASFAMAGTSFLGSLVLLRYLPRYLPRLSRFRQ